MWRARLRRESSWIGTDAAVYPHGLNAHEFAVMVKLGLTPLQAIQAATMNDADLLGGRTKSGRSRRESGRILWRWMAIRWRMLRRWSG